MYSEDYEEREKRGFPFRDFLLKLILIIIFVLLLIWLVPWPNNKVLTDRIFNANIQEMKNASLLYFTEERLPVNVGDKKTITLQEMLDLKLLLPFTDKNGNACDVQNSYVTIEKLETEYLLKVYLKCGEEEDYILVHVGCYAYCTTTVCEKEEPDKTPGTTPTPTNKPPRPTPTSNPTPTPTNKPTPTPTPTNPPVNDSQPYCTLVVTDGILDSDNVYISNVTIGWGSKGSTNGATITGYGLGTSLNYKNENTYVVTKNGTTTVYGYVKDSNGKTASCHITVSKKDKDIPPETKYEYEYKKEIGKQYSAWSAWSPDTVYVDADNIRFGNFELLQVQDLGARDQIVGYKYYNLTYRKTKPIYLGTYKKEVCTGYKYEIIENTVYTTGEWQKTNVIWEGSVAPKDTATEKWVYESFDQSTCLPECTDHTILVWRKYVRTANSVGSKDGTVNVSCANKQTMDVPLYATQTINETQRLKVDVWAKVKYYRYRTRTITQNAYTDYKWSENPNDPSLISQGYTATGKKRVKE